METQNRSNMEQRYMYINPQDDKDSIVGTAEECEQWRVEKKLSNILVGEVSGLTGKLKTIGEVLVTEAEIDRIQAQEK